MVISIESLVELFEDNNDPDQFIYGDQCCFCGCDVEIVITKTSQGYGINGGVLLGLNPKKLRVICERCFLKSGREYN